MDSGLLLSSSDMDLASAGSFASGGQNAATGLAGPGVGAATSAPPSDGSVRGLVPPSSDSPRPATGLQGPGDAGGAAGAPGGDQGDGSLSYMQRVAKALGGDPYHIRYTDGLGGTGLQSARLIPVAGGFGGGAPTAEGTPFEISTNPRTAAALDALSDINSNVDFTGGLTAIRDMSDAAAYMNELQARGAVDRVKSLFRKDLINPPTESQLGALPNYVKNESGEAVQVYDQNDLLQRFLGAYRMSLLERQGAIELDHDHWKIKSIGNTKLTPEQFVKEFGSRYQSAFADSVQEADRNLAAGVRPLGDNVALPIQRGYMADQGAKRAASTYLNSIGVPEGPGQVVALNRRAYYQDGSGLHARPDVLIDAGIPHRHILDGKATKFEDLSPPMRSQLGGYHDLGVDTVEGVTQHGSVPIPREETPRRRR